MSKNFTNLPTDILYTLFRTLKDEDRALLLLKVPELYKDFVPKSNKIVIIFIMEDQQIPENFGYRFGSPIKYYIELPKEFEYTNKVHHLTPKYMDPIRRQIYTILPKIKDSQPVALEFAFDLESNDIYTICDFYAELFPYFYDIEHFLNIYKTARPIKDLTKSKFKDLGLTDACMSIKINNEINDNTLMNLEFLTPTILLKTKNYVRSTVLFQDLDWKTKTRITSITSSLKGINIILPSLINNHSFNDQKSNILESKISELLDLQYSLSRVNILHSTFAALDSLFDKCLKSNNGLKEFHQAIVTDLSQAYIYNNALDDHIITGNELKAVIWHTFFTFFDFNELTIINSEYSKDSISMITEVLSNHVDTLIKSKLKIGNRFLNLNILGEVDSMKSQNNPFFNDQLTSTIEAFKNFIKFTNLW